MIIVAVDHHNVSGSSHAGSPRASLGRVASTRADLSGAEQGPKRRRRLAAMGEFDVADLYRAAWVQAVSALMA